MYPGYACPSTAIERRPSSLVSDVIVDWYALADNIARAVQLEYKVVAVWAQLNLGVPLGTAEEEHFNYFMIPQLVGGANRAIGCLSKV